MFSEVDRFNYEQSFEIEKSLSPDLISVFDLADLLKSGYEIVDGYDDFEKAQKDITGLIKKEVWVTRNGKTFKQTVYVKEKEEDKKVETPIGGEMSPDIKGMQISKYSEKAMLITGDTKSNLEELRDIKKEIGAGVWNNKLQGWVFPIKYVGEVLGRLWSKADKSGDDEKADAIQNTKNAAFEAGDTAEMQGVEGKVTGNVSDSEGTKYNVDLPDGTKLKGVDEKVMGKKPETDAKKTKEILETASPTTKVPTTKKLYGIKPVADIHNYSLEEYLAMHGISQADIDAVIKGFKKPKKETTGYKPKSGSSSKPKKDKPKIEGLSKRQIIAKLVYAHYQAVKGAIDAGKDVPTKALELYPELKVDAAKKKKQLSEEHKKKIAEALKKNKPDEEKPKKPKATKPETPEEKSKKIYDSLSEEQKKQVAEIDAAAKAKVNKEKLDAANSKLVQLVDELAYSKEMRQQSLNDAKDADKYSSEYDAAMKNARVHGQNIDSLNIKVQHQGNVIRALSGGGDITSFKDKQGVEHTNMPDFRKVDVQNIGYDEDNILNEKTPPYIPAINEVNFEKKGFSLDVVKVGEDSYVLATNNHNERPVKPISPGDIGHQASDYDKELGNYTMVTLDQLVLIQDYYVTKKKAIYKKEAADKNAKMLEKWNSMDDSIKKKYLENASYQGLPAKVKKKVTAAEWNNSTWQEREKHYKPIKTFGAKKIKTKFDEHTMPTSFHDMHERFADPTAKKYDKTGKEYGLGSGSHYGKVYGSKKTFKSWNDFADDLKWKLNDLKVQKENYSETYKKAIETSFGESNLNKSYVDSLGVGMKMQNGSDIKPVEMQQLKGAWEDVQKTFGALTENAKADGLKLAHSGDKYIFASKAVGVYVPSKKTISVSNKMGGSQFNATMGHEVAHWIDHTLGKAQGKRHISDNYESTAGKIAKTLRKNMNKKSDSKYMNATHECFARALEMHHANSLGDTSVFNDSRMCSKETYDTQLKPLIEKFFTENKNLLKSELSDLFKAF